MESCKEYLEKQPDGTYSLVLRGDLCKGNDIEVPEGADKYAHFNEYDNANFYKGDFDAVWQDDGYWDYDMDDYKSYCKKFGVVLWQRATHPEELPFIDDEPKYTDDEVKYMDENEQGRLQSINDQYAEIEQVRQVEIHSTVKAAQAAGGVDATLAERQSTYGCFEDVAFVTENIMSILAKVRPDGLQDLPYAHRMALYMIASKMARIVNGDFNHLDSWHDIGGYSKLIEKLIKGE